MNEQIEKVKAEIRINIYKLEREIYSTSTGNSRNALCDANIHLRAALDALELVK